MCQMCPNWPFPPPHHVPKGTLRISLLPAMIPCLLPLFGHS